MTVSQRLSPIVLTHPWDCSRTEDMPRLKHQAKREMCIKKEKLQQPHMGRQVRVTNASSRRAFPFQVTVFFILLSVASD